ncbi:LamG-like jellyroll fold domain-containing protein [Flavobacterium caeni]|uniref:Concanavalin A-like lectin/glucanases superfamily protein n=1 Tax=Flavobacterium caeni TaxID=490189 RepID=A0A1G5B8W9_9FLAO|nr:LamG-like jellyroll fold domain-containing protein [Flavobacterium caeni]SCX86552.1 Concanavalin A-like lectin/glucanases superfamily protein [Flavobacterium caeni]
MKTMKLTGFALTAALGIGLVSCSDDDNNNGFTQLPPIGGYYSADEVGAADLLAYWPLNGNGTESKSNTAPNNTQNTSWVSGIKGQAASFNTGFLDYPSIPALNSPEGSITISCWAKISNTKLVDGGPSNISPIVAFSGGPNTNIGNLALFGNTHGLVSSDSIQIKAEFHFAMPDGVTDFNGDCINMIKQESWMDDTHTWNPNKIGGQWAHIVYVYDGSTANNRIYVNGVKISNSAWESRNNGDAMPMDFFQPTHPMIGATPSVANGTNSEAWNAALKGDVDEVRVWKKVLSLADINSLYQLELAGR